MHLVAHERLRSGLHIDRCDCHGAIKCPALDTLARIHEGQTVVPNDMQLPREDGIALVAWVIVMTGCLVTGFSVGQLLAEWVLS